MTSAVTPQTSTTKTDLIIALACAGAFAMALFYLKPETTSRAYNFGQAIAYAFFAIVVLGVTVLSSAGKKRLVFAYVALLVSFFAGTMIAANQAVEKEKAAINAILPDIEKDAQALLESRDPELKARALEQRIVAPDPTNQASPPSNATDPAGAYRSLQLALSSMFQKQVQMQKDYESDLIATGYSALLDPERLKSDPTGAKGFAILQRAHSVVLKHRARSEAMLGNLPQEARQHFIDSQLPPRAVTAIVEGLEKGASVAQLRAERIWDLEEEVVAELGALLKVFASAQGWQEGSDSFLFPLDEQAAAFNAHTSRIQAIIQEQDAIRKSADEGLKSMVGKLKTLAAQP